METFRTDRLMLRGVGKNFNSGAGANCGEKGG
jgi:hypothetical protein